MTITVVIRDLPDGSFAIDSSFDPPLPEDRDAVIEVTSAMGALARMLKALDTDPDLCNLPLLKAGEN